MVLDLGGSPPATPAATAGLQARPEPRARTGTVLLYERVVAHVERLIADQRLTAGDLLPSYAELAAQSGVSLITVRRALDELERAGKVRRHQGLGTFVARPRIIAEPGRPGSLLSTLTAGEPAGAAAQAAGQHGAAAPTGDEAAAEGHGGPAGALAEPAAELLETRVLDLHRGQPSRYLAGALQLTDGQVWRLVRLRLIDGQPAVLETSVIPVTLAPELDYLVERLEGSLYDLLAREYFLADAYEEQYLEVVLPLQHQARLLEIPSRAQVVRIRGVSADSSGLPFDCFEQLYPANQFAFAISGSASRQLLPAPGDRDWDVRPAAEPPEPR